MIKKLYNEPRRRKLPKLAGRSLMRSLGFAELHLPSRTLHRQSILHYCLALLSLFFSWTSAKATCLQCLLGTVSKSSLVRLCPSIDYTNASTLFAAGTSHPELAEIITRRCVSVVLVSKENETDTGAIQARRSSGKG